MLGQNKRVEQFKDTLVALGTDHRYVAPLAHAVDTGYLVKNSNEALNAIALAVGLTKDATKQHIEQGIIRVVPKVREQIEGHLIAAQSNDILNEYAKIDDIIIRGGKTLDAMIRNPVAGDPYD